MDRTVKIGIIGCGGIANGKHMPSLKKIKNAQMVAFCDIIEERAVKAQRSTRTIRSFSRIRILRLFTSARRTAHTLLFQSMPWKQASM